MAIEFKVARTNSDLRQMSKITCCVTLFPVTQPRPAATYRLRSAANQRITLAANPTVPKRRNKKNKTAPPENAKRSTDARESD